MYCFVFYVLNAISKRTGGMKKLRKDSLQVAVSTMNLKTDSEVDNLLKKMNIKSDYFIVNQTLETNVRIKNRDVMTVNETGLSKSRNVAINNSDNDIILLADDDVKYDNSYEKIVLEAWQKYNDADIICFYVESKNKQRKTKRMHNGKIGYIRAMRIVSFEISFKRKSILDNNLKFNEKFGIGTKINRGEEQIFLYEAIRKGLKIIFVNKKIAEVEQESSNWFTKYDEEFFIVQGEIFKQMSSKFYWIIIFQYAVRKYFLYRKNVSFSTALKCMMCGNRNICIRKKTDTSKST